MSQKNPELIVALDYPSQDQAWKLIQETQGFSVIWKIGSELFLSTGPEFIRKVVNQGGRVFLDLKLHDIPNTVAKAADRIGALGIEMFTLHISGGRKMIEETRSTLERFGPKRPKILGVSVLTSFDNADWGEVTRALAGTPNAEQSIEKSVAALAKAAAEWGIDGLVCSSHELKTVRSATPGIWTVIPGIRQTGDATQDQARVMTPREAKVAGAHAIVVGRPITQAVNPREKIESILQELG